jgi:hypothetical protein
LAVSLSYITPGCAGSAHVQFADVGMLPTPAATDTAAESVHTAGLRIQDAESSRDGREWAEVRAVTQPREQLM